MPTTFDISEAGSSSPQTQKNTQPPSDRGGGTGLPIDGPAKSILWLAISVALLAVVYLFWGTYSGAWANPAFSALPHLDRLRQINNIDLFTQILRIACLVGVIAFLVTCFRDTGVGYVLTALGFLCYAGIPALSGVIFSQRGFSPSLATHEVTANIQSLGLLFGAPGIAWMAADFMRRFQVAAENAAIQRAGVRYGSNVGRQKEAQRTPTAFSRCWELPYCREHVKVKCPIYIRRLGPCWWYKEGCMCEERIVLQAVIDSSWKDKTKEATAQAGIQTASLATGFSGQPKRILSPAGKRERCRNCIIYNEHERQKYKVLVGLVLIGFPLFVYANADQFQALTVTVLATLEQLSERFSFGDKHSTVSFLHNNPSPTIEWVMIGAASLIILSQLLRLVEYFCFKLKI